jgi:hypothetical protein
MNLHFSPYKIRKKGLYYRVEGGSIAGFAASTIHSKYPDELSIAARRLGTAGGRFGTGD